MNLDVVADDKFHAGQANAIGRNPPPAKRGGRIGKVQHHLSSRFRDAGEVELLGFIVDKALVDEALVAFGAGYRHVLPVMQKLCRIAGTDNRRQPELAADDGGVRRDRSRSRPPAA